MSSIRWRCKASVRSSLFVSPSSLLNPTRAWPSASPKQKLIPHYVRSPGKIGCATTKLPPNHCTVVEGKEPGQRPPLDTPGWPFNTNAAQSYGWKNFTRSLA